MTGTRPRLASDVLPPRRASYMTTAGATWRSGYAEDCKSLHPGSIPGVASRFTQPSISRGRRFWRETPKPQPISTSKLCNPRQLCYSRATFRGSSVVEQSAVNRSVVGSNPTRGASYFKDYDEKPRAPRGAFSVSGNKASKIGIRPKSDSIVIDRDVIATHVASETALRARTWPSA